MAETIIKTLTCLLIAAAIGFAVAWLLRGLNLAELRERINALVRDLIERDGRIHALQVESGGQRVQLGTETGKLRGAMSELGSLAAALTSTRAERDDERRSVAHWQDQHQNMKTRTAEMETEILNLRD